jgi:hypothetical protein
MGSVVMDVASDAGVQLVYLSQVALGRRSELRAQADWNSVGGPGAEFDWLAAEVATRNVLLGVIDQCVRDGRLESMTCVRRTWIAGRSVPSTEPIS